MNRKVVVVSDAKHLLSIPNPRDDASVASLLSTLNVSMQFKAGEPVTKDEFWDGVDACESRQWNRERAVQHAEQARFKAAQQPGEKLESLEDKE